MTSRGICTWRYGSIDIIHPLESGECPRLAGFSIQSKALSID